MRTVILALAVCLAATSAQSDPLTGTWKSDRELTLQRLAIDKVPERHRRTVIEEGDLGNAVVQFRNGEYTWTLGERRISLPYRILGVDGNQVDFEYFQHARQTNPKRLRLFVTSDLLYLPIGEFNFYEVFRRLSPPAEAAP